jgi:hypothetical protein
LIIRLGRGVIFHNNFAAALPKRTREHTPGTKAE